MAVFLLRIWLEIILIQLKPHLDQMSGGVNYGGRNLKRCHHIYIKKLK